MNKELRPEALREAMVQEARRIFQLTGNPSEEDLEEVVEETCRLAQMRSDRAITRDVQMKCLAEALMTLGCYDEARACILETSSGNDRLMDELDSIAFKAAADVPVKRENANINGDTPMGIMLRFGSEAAKQLHLSRHIAPHFAAAHQAGDIHIHDLDFYAQTTT